MKEDHFLWYIHSLIYIAHRYLIEYKANSHHVQYVRVVRWNTNIDLRGLSQIGSCSRVGIFGKFEIRGSTVTTVSTLLKNCVFASFPFPSPPSPSPTLFCLDLLPLLAFSICLICLSFAFQPIFALHYSRFFVVLWNMRHDKPLFHLTFLFF